MLEGQAGVNRERWHHKPTGRRAVLVIEVAGACELEGLDGNSIYANRADLDNPEILSRIP
jgi:hypothetical protein